MDKICFMGQLSLILDENDNIKFYSARPIAHTLEIEGLSHYDAKAIRIPKHMTISNLQNNIFLKNKYDAIDIDENETGFEFGQFFIKIFHILKTLNSNKAS